MLPSFGLGRSFEVYIRVPCSAAFTKQTAYILTSTDLTWWFASLTYTLQTAKNNVMVHTVYIIANCMQKPWDLEN